MARTKRHASSNETLETLCAITMTTGIPATVRKRAYLAVMKLIGRFLKLPWLPEQIRMGWRILSLTRESLEVACRGGGKTLLHVICAFIICTGEYTLGIWLAGDSGQLSEAVTKTKELLKLFTFANEGRDEYGHYRITFPNGSILDYNACTMTSGPRKNLIILDEGGKITDSDKYYNYMNAHGMAEGTYQSPVRLRHCTTLAYGTPGEAIYHALEPIGLVHKLVVDQVPWVWRDGAFDQDPVIQQMPRWWVLMEYWCELVAKGGSVFKEPPVIIDDFDLDQACVAHPLHVIITAVDWNPVWGDAAVAIFWDKDQDDYVVFDEIRTTDTQKLILFFKQYMAYNNYRVCEKSGEKVFGKTKELEDAGITFHEHELWDRATQTLKVTRYQGLSEHGKIKYLRSCTNVIRQHQLYHFKEGKGSDDAGSNEIPKQEDHHLDATSHALRMAHCSPSLWNPDA